MSYVEGLQNRMLTKIIIRTIAIMSLDLMSVMTGSFAGISIADQVATRTNVGMTISSPGWNADLAILFGAIGFLTISLGGVFITHRLLHASSDHVAYWALPLILGVFVILLEILHWRLDFNLGIWQT